MRCKSRTEGNIHCLFCQFGSDDESLNEILDHLTVNHPNEFAYVCMRSKGTPGQELTGESLQTHTSIEAIGKSTAKRVEFKGNVEKLKSSSDGSGDGFLVIRDVMTVN